MNEQKPLVVIGDVHGMRIWEKIVSKHPNCKYIFLGDYNDPINKIEDIDVLDNFKRIIQFKHENIDDTVLLIGNHDIHYMRRDVGICSRFNIRLEDRLFELFDRYNSYFVNAHQEGNILFTHAGATEEWFSRSFKAESRDNAAYQLNHLTEWQSSTDVLLDCGTYRGGLHKYSGILWADKREMKYPLEGYIQVVGHSRVNKIAIKTSKAHKGIEKPAACIFCDSLHKDKYLYINPNKPIEERFLCLSIDKAEQYFLEI